MKSKIIATMARALLGASLAVAGSAVMIEVGAVTSPPAGAATATQVLMTSTQNPGGGVGAQCFAGAGAGGVTFTPPAGGVMPPVNANSTNGFPNNGAVVTGTAPVLTVCWRGPDVAPANPADNICWVVQVWPSILGVGRVPVNGGYNRAGTCTVPDLAPVVANFGPLVWKIGQAGAAGVDATFDGAGPFNGVSYRAGVKECDFGAAVPVAGAACPAVVPAPTMVASPDIMPRAAPNQPVIPQASYQHTSLQHFVVGLGLIKIMYVWFNPALVRQGFADSGCSYLGPQCQWEGPPSERYYQGQVTLGGGGAALFNQAVQIYRVNSARWVATFQCTAGQNYVMKFAPEIRTTATYPGGPAIPVQILAGQTTTSAAMGC